LTDHGLAWRRDKEEEKGKQAEEEGGRSMKKHYQGS